MGPSDHELMGRVQRQDAGAFEALFARYREILRRHLANTVRDGAAADDLVQELFLRVWTRAEQWDGRGAFKAWLFRIATNLALNHLRSVRRRRELPLDPPADPAGEESDSPAPGWMIDASPLGPEAALEEAERSARLRHLIDALPEDAARLPGCEGVGRVIWPIRRREFRAAAGAGVGRSRRLGCLRRGVCRTAPRAQRLRR